MYQSSHFHQGTPQALSLIADTVLNPSYLHEEIEAQRDAARYEVRELSSKPEQILPEVLHTVAYGGTGLGNPLMCPEERIDSMNGHTLRKFMKEWYRPERMVIAGAGMPHEELVELADKHFSSLKYVDRGEPAPAPSPLLRSTSPPPLSASTSPPSVVKSISRAASYLFPTSQPAASDAPQLLNTALPYTGGHRFIYDPSTEFNHLYIAFEGCGIRNDDIYALATMQVLLGGGGSFSAGGPGKGMYSRLYTHILNHYPQVDHCAAFHHIYTDSSLFGLFASFVPYSKGRSAGNTPAQILPHLVHQLSVLLYTPIPAAELNRAKNQLKSALMMALESRAVEVEDLGRQVCVPSGMVRAAPTNRRSGSGAQPPDLCVGDDGQDRRAQAIGHAQGRGEVLWARVRRQGHRGMHGARGHRLLAGNIRKVQCSGLNARSLRLFTKRTILIMRNSSS
jgi:processing peptidase subunit alpha